MSFEKKTLIQSIAAAAIFAYCLIVANTNSATLQKDFIHKTINISTTREDIKKWVLGAKDISQKTIIYSGKAMDRVVYFFENGFGPTDSLPKETVLASETENVGITPDTEPIQNQPETESTVQEEEVKKHIFRMPSNGRITSDYGKRTHPISNENNIHYGIDIAGNTGDCVIASLPGTVEDTGTDPALGNYVKIRHSPTMQTVYGHLSEIMVVPGEVVDGNTRIGSIGATGYATGPHLHLEVRIDGKSVDPNDYIGKEI